MPSDAWIMASILAACAKGGRASLEEIIGYGDAINHAIFTYEELDSGLTRLSSAGLIDEAGGEFQETAVAAEWRQALSAMSVDSQGAITWLREHLNALEPATMGSQPSFHGLSRRRFDEAVTANSAAMKEFLAKLGKRDGA